MIKLVYDLKCGYEEVYVVAKDWEYDLTCMLESSKSGLVEYWDELKEERRSLEEALADPLLTEEGFYAAYKDDIDGLWEHLESNGELEMIYESSLLNIAHIYFSHILRVEKVAPGIWEPSNIRLIYDPEVKSDCFFNNGLAAADTCELLQISRQQLHYYVRTGQIRKEYNAAGTKYRYNKNDVYTVLEKLKKKNKPVIILSNHV